MKWKLLLSNNECLVKKSYKIFHTILYSKHPMYLMIITSNGSIYMHDLFVFPTFRWFHMCKTTLEDVNNFNTPKNWIYCVILSQVLAFICVWWIWNKTMMFIPISSILVSVSHCKPLSYINLWRYHLLIV